MIQHLVLLRWREDAADRDIERAVAAMNDLRGIDGVSAVAFGRAIEPNRHGYTHALVANIRDRAALAAYGPHPIHMQVAAKLMPLAADAIIFDFVA